MIYLKNVRYLSSCLRIHSNRLARDEQLIRPLDQCCRIRGKFISLKSLNIECDSIKPQRNAGLRTEQERSLNDVMIYLCYSFASEQQTVRFHPINKDDVRIGTKPPLGDLIQKKNMFFSVLISFSSAHLNTTIVKLPLWIPIMLNAITQHSSWGALWEEN